MDMGAVFFFDDYFSVLTTGAVARPITDGLRIPREKLAFMLYIGGTSALLHSILLTLAATFVYFKLRKLSSVILADRAGFSVRLHALGDGAVKLGLATRLPRS